MQAISIDMLRERLDYDPTSGVLTWKPRLGVGGPDGGFNAGLVGKAAGNLKKGGHRAVHLRIEGKSFSVREHRIAWAIYYGAWPTAIVDHIDGNASNNRIGNLRLATSSQNSMNRSCATNSKSGVKGVYKAKNRWRAQINVSKKIRHLGTFATKEEAAKAYSVAAKEAFGEYARTI